MNYNAAGLTIAVLGLAIFYGLFMSVRNFLLPSLLVFAFLEIIALFLFVWAELVELKKRVKKLES